MFLRSRPPVRRCSSAINQVASRGKINTPGDFSGWGFSPKGARPELRRGVNSLEQVYLARNLSGLPKSADLA
jgi:hypothetical protein